MKWKVHDSTVARVDSYTSIADFDPSKIAACKRHYLAAAIFPTRGLNPVCANPDELPSFSSSILAAFGQPIFRHKDKCRDSTKLL